ncbi:hypothetical protein COCON_G00041740 [Conger conger]|uniref:Uncharacterized protein n=1 Tax=Conger conger TaxID=82655 RepID=A0A9Q1I4M8_CONCO|nr:hypothetical protein COCON_G00041740 [Conger conger]
MPLAPRPISMHCIYCSDSLSPRGRRLSGLFSGFLFSVSAVEVDGPPRPSSSAAAGDLTRSPFPAIPQCPARMDGHARNGHVPRSPWERSGGEGGRKTFCPY